MFKHKDINKDMQIKQRQTNEKIIKKIHQKINKDRQTKSRQNNKKQNPSYKSITDPHAHCLWKTLQTLNPKP